MATLQLRAGRGQVRSATSNRWSQSRSNVEHTFRQLRLNLIKDSSMARRSNIEWTDMTWNPVTGCTKVSPGCKHCYAETLAKRLQRMGVKGYENGFGVTLLPERL